MAQTMTSQPLETLQHRLMDWLRTLIIIPLALTATTYRRRARAAWRTLQGKDLYHGMRYLPDEESLPWQWRMAAALGGSDRALIVIKIHQWIEHNKSEGRPATTYNGYSEWAGDHFGHLSDASIGYHVRALEAMKILITKRVGRSGKSKSYDQRKSYRIDYGRLNTLVSKVKTAKSDMKPDDSLDQKSNSKTKKPDSNLNNDSNGSTQFSNQSLKPNASTQEKPTNQGRGGRRAGAGRKPKQKETLTEPTTASTAAGLDTASVEALPITTPDQDSSLPGSAEPLSHPEASLIGRLMDQGLDEDKAAALIDSHGADRVRAVVYECERRLKSERGQKIEKPPGWIIAELKNNIFKLKPMTAESPDHWFKSMTLEEMESDSDSPTLSGDAQLEPVPTDPIAVDRWTEALKLLEASMQKRGPAVFVNTLWDSEVIRFDADEAVYCVRTQTPDHAQRSRFHITMILEALQQVHGGPCRVEFESR